jgi:hypothetical protein
MRLLGLRRRWLMTRGTGTDAQVVRPGNRRMFGPIDLAAAVVFADRSVAYNLIMTTSEFESGQFLRAP